MGGFDEMVFDRSRAERINVEFQKLGARGVSLIFASGDGGAAGGSSRSECPPFQPVFPAASPWVTAVGGTTSAYPEVCWQYSSGGFSNYWKRPSFQDAAIEAYFSNPTIRYPDASLYNNTGAGFPDVAAQATDYTVVFDGKAYQSWGGTSAAAPTFTAIIGLVNAARLAAGKRGLGYLNPLIYKVLGPGGAFNDITSGFSQGCADGSDDVQVGFHAAQGWDPVTGFGTPSYKKIVAMVLDLP